MKEGWQYTANTKRFECDSLLFLLYFSMSPTASAFLRWWIVEVEGRAYKGSTHSWLSVLLSLVRFSRLTHSRNGESILAQSWSKPVQRACQQSFFSPPLSSGMNTSWKTLTIFYAQETFPSCFPKMRRSGMGLWHAVNITTGIHVYPMDKDIPTQWNTNLVYPMLINTTYRISMSMRNMVYDKARSPEGI